MTERGNVLLLVLAVAATATASVLIKEAREAPSIVIAAYRLLLGSIVIWLPVARSRNRASLGALGARGTAMGVLAGVLVAGHFATWIASLKLTNVASSLALVTAHPLAVAVGSRWLLKERLSPGTTIGIVIGLVGVAWLALLDRKGGGEESLLGDALAFAGCLFVAGYFLCGRWMRGSAPLWPYVAVNYATAAAVLVTCALVTGAPVTGFTPRTYGLLVLLGLVPQGIGHTLLNRSLRHFRAPTVSLAALGEVPGATFLAWVLLGERVPLPRALAVTMILVAVAIAVRPTRRTMVS